VEKKDGMKGQKVSAEKRIKNTEEGVKKQDRKE